MRAEYNFSNEERKELIPSVGKTHLTKDEKPVTESRLREILWEVLPPAASGLADRSTRASRKQSAG